MIVVIGKSGQLAQALKNVFLERCVLLGRSDIDLRDFKSASATLKKLNPTAIINASAYTFVDKAETEVDEAHFLNGAVPGFLAQYCATLGIPFVHYSTDYVFDGTGEEPWTESDPTGPVGVYGKSKLAGEQAVLAAGGQFVILRTSWVFSETGTNFVKTMLRLGMERESLKVVDDQIGAPTYAGDLALTTEEILESLTTGQSGIYHCTNSGEVSWKGFAQEIFNQARDIGFKLKVKSVEGIPSSEYPTAARRPLNSRLDNEELDMTFGISLPPWQESLRLCLENIYENN